MTETETTSQTPPACERCGTTTFPSRRKMLRYLTTQDRQTIPQEGEVDTWRCPRCGREAPRG